MQHNKWEKILKKDLRMSSAYSSRKRFSVNLKILFKPDCCHISVCVCVSKGSAVPEAPKENRSESVY